LNFQKKVIWRLIKEVTMRDRSLQIINEFFRKEKKERKLNNLRKEKNLYNKRSKKQKKKNKVG